MSPTTTTEPSTIPAMAPPESPGSAVVNPSVFTVVCFVVGGSSVTAVVVAGEVDVIAVTCAVAVVCSKVVIGALVVVGSIVVIGTLVVGAFVVVGALVVARVVVGCAVASTVVVESWFPFGNYKENNIYKYTHIL